VRIRDSERADSKEIGRLYFDPYGPGLVGNLDKATADIAASFDGEYGELWLKASPVALIDGDIVDVLMTVVETPWERTPEGPFIIELFIDSAFRSMGIARCLMEHALDIMESPDWSDT